MKPCSWMGAVSGVPGPAWASSMIPSSGMDMPRREASRVPSLAAQLSGVSCANCESLSGLWQPRLMRHEHDHQRGRDGAEDVEGQARHPRFDLVQHARQPRATGVKVRKECECELVRGTARG